MIEDIERFTPSSLKSSSRNWRVHKYVISNWRWSRKRA